MKETQIYDTICKKEMSIFLYFCYRFSKYQNILDEAQRELTTIVKQNSQNRSMEEIHLYALYSIPDSLCRIITWYIMTRGHICRWCKIKISLDRYFLYKCLFVKYIRRLNPSVNKSILILMSLTGLKISQGQKVIDD